LRSFIDIDATLAGVPADLVAVLAKVEYGRGREELFRAQASQVLERLAARTRFDSITASSAIENVVVSDERALKLLRDPAATDASFRNRSEAEFAGYRDATDELLGKRPEPLTVPLILHVHRLLMRHTGDPLAGRLKTDDNVIGDRDPDGRVTVVFKPVPAGRQTASQLTEVVARYEQAIADARLPPALLLSALVLDFLAIHPFQDGNGRVARLLTAGELLRHGYGVARYVSIEQRIFETKHSYYAALRASQAGWHVTRHDVWPWAGYLLRILQDAYDDFARRIASGLELVGATKEEQARNYILTQAPRSFRLAQIADALPDISHATIRNALDGLKADGLLQVGRGRSATWTRVGEPAHDGRQAD
jgi:Fic family protein